MKLFKNIFNSFLNQVSIIVFINTLVLTKHVFGQDNYYYERYTMSDGLSSNQISGIFKDSKGLLWVGTFNGLNRFDGYRFTKYFHDPEDPNSIPSNYIQNITEDQNGKLWIAMYNGLATYDYNTDKFTTLKPGFKYDYDKLESVYCDSKNRIWISTNKGLYLLSTAGKIIQFWNEQNGIKGNSINGVYEDKSKQIWASGHEGVFRYNEKTSSFIRIQVKKPPYVKSNFYINNCNTIGAEDDTALYMGSWGNGIRWINKKTGELHTRLINPNSKDLSSANNVFNVCYFNHKLWLTTDHGLATYNLKSGKTEYINNQLFGEFGAPKGASGLYTNGPILWISSGIGLFKHDMRKQQFTPHKLDEIEDNKPCLEGFNDIFPLKSHPDSIIISTWTCGVFGYNILTKKLSKILDPVLENQNDIYPLEFNKFISDKKGNLWAACSHGIYQRNRKGKSTFVKPYPEAIGLAPENYINDITIDSSGNVWALSNNGIYFFKDSELGYERILAKEDSSGNLGKIGNWISCTVLPNGDIYFLNLNNSKKVYSEIIIYKNQNKVFQRLSQFKNLIGTNNPVNNANGIYNDGENIWLTGRKGIYSFEIKNPEKRKLYNSKKGLISDRCLNLAFDKSGNIWTTSQDGISKINCKTGIIKNYSTNDILPAAHAGAIEVDALNRVYIGFSGEWLFVFDKNKLYRDDNVNAVYPIELKLNDIRQKLNTDLTLPYDFSNLHLTFSALNYANPKENNYQITIISKERKISSYQTAHNELFISTLPHGKNRIEIKLIGGNNSIPLILNIEVKPAIWQTLWFYIFIILIISIFTFYLIRLRINRLRKRVKKENELKLKVSAAEMSALRSQMNPHFIFNALNGIHNLIWEHKFIEASEYLTKFSRVTRKVLENSRSQLISLSDDLEALNYFIQLEALNFEYGLNYKIEIDPSIDQENTRIPPLVLQPFVENAIKHGLKTLEIRGELSIELKPLTNELYCVIQDNGIGRKQAEALPGHTSLGTTITSERFQVFNQLYNTHARYRYEDLKSEDGRNLGTRVHIYLPYFKMND